MNKATQIVEKPAYHYFGSTAWNWATGASRAEVLTKLAREAGADLIRRNVKASGGLYAWTVRVNLPADAEYGIENYAPRGVPTECAEAFRIQNTKGHALPLEK